MIVDLWREALRRNRLLTLLAATHVILFFVLGASAVVDSTSILGISRWVKPMKFAISIALFLGTMGWLLGYLENSRRSIARVSWTMGLTMTMEMGLIVMQSVRGVRSHFNAETALDGVIFMVMGVLILVNTLAATWATILFFVRRSSASAGLLSGIRWGMLLLLLASLEAGLMIGRGSHTVGTADGGAGLPFVNWSTSAGDLRVAHFAGMHALQALPLFGLFLDRRAVRGARACVAIVALGWIAITAFLVAQALAGRPLLV